MKGNAMPQLDVTERQAEIIAYALTLYRRQCRDKATDESRDKAREIEEIEWIIDAAP